MPPPQMSELEPTFQNWTAVIASETGITTVTNLPAMRRLVGQKDLTAGPLIGILSFKTLQSSVSAWLLASSCTSLQFLPLRTT